MKVIKLRVTSPEPSANALLRQGFVSSLYVFCFVLFSFLHKGQRAVRFSVHLCLSWHNPENVVPCIRYEIALEAKVKPLSFTLLEVTLLAF